MNQILITGTNKKRQERWVFSDEMVQDLLEIVKDIKINMEGRGLDFEGDLIKLYSEIRVSMAEKYNGFGPNKITQPEIEIDEMTKEQYKAFKKINDEEEKAIKHGYERIKAKVKKLRSNFQKAVAESTRSGSGRIIRDNWDTLLAIWGGAPGAEPLDFGLNTMGEEVSETAQDHTELDVALSDQGTSDSNKEMQNIDSEDEQECGPTKQKSRSVLLQDLLMTKGKN